MKLVVLGSGTCVPSLKRNAPGYYLEADECRILVDCGSGTLLQLEKAGRSYKDIDAVFITHRHPDHFADLIPLIHALLATPKFKREKALFIIGPKEFLEYYHKTASPIFSRLRDFSIQLIEAYDKLDFSCFHIFTTKTIHSKGSIAYRFEYNGKSIVFTGDADYDPGIIGLAQHADLLIADCSFPHSQKAKGHLSARECGLVAQKAEVKRLLLSHLYPADTPDSERIKEAREVFKGDIILAEDLMEINL
jgi:ribonuclease BN (tRNA processing enzyme)